MSRHLRALIISSALAALGTLHPRAFGLSKYSRPLGLSVYYLFSLLIQLPILDEEYISLLIQVIQLKQSTQPRTRRVIDSCSSVE